MTRVFARRGVRAVVTLLIVAIVCTSPGVAAASAPPGGNGSSSGGGNGTSADVLDSQFTTATDSVSVWKNAPFPLRTDPSASNGTVVDNQQMTVFSESMGAEVRVNKQQLAVFNPDEEIPMSFQSRYPVTTAPFGNADVKLLAAKTDPNASNPAFNTSNVSATGTMETLTNTEQTDNVSFELVDIGSLRGGAIETSYNVSESGPARGPGQYMFFVVQATEGDGFTVDDGNLSVDGQARVLGMDAAVVQTAPASASVSTTDSAPGDTVSFDVNSTFDSSNVSHAVVLYNETQYADARTRVSVDGTLSSDLSPDQVTATSSIVGVNGAVSVDDNATFGGMTLGDGPVRSQTTLSSLTDTVVDRSNATERLRGNAPNRGADPSNRGANPANRGGGPPGMQSTWFDASMTGVASENGTTTVDVATADDWNEGTYRYVYIAQDGDDMSTTTGTVELGNETSES